ncbi:hypothetical protein GGQ18_003242 [Salinibacter ruber]|nr:hypothetical protein [Salinibacter ruber]
MRTLKHAGGSNEADTININPGSEAALNLTSGGTVHIVYTRNPM